MENLTYFSTAMAEDSYGVLVMDCSGSMMINRSAGGTRYQASKQESGEKLF